MLDAGTSAPNVEGRQRLIAQRRLHHRLATFGLSLTNFDGILDKFPSVMLGLLNGNTPPRAHVDSAHVQANWPIRTPYTPLSCEHAAPLVLWWRLHRASSRDPPLQCFLVMPNGCRQ